MTVSQMHVHTGRVSTEGDELHYEVRGSGEPLLMIPGARGDAWWYAPIADVLADEYKVITYDRRANSRSTRHTPQNFEVSQQSRDAVAVLHAAGERSAFVFGTSSGAVIALDLAKTQPHTVRAVVAHEPPIVRVHPKAWKWQRFFAGVYKTALRFGATAALLRFAIGVRTGMPMRQMIRAATERNAARADSGVHHLTPQQVSDFFVRYELLPVTNYLPDFAGIRERGVRVVMGVGRVNLERRRWYVESSEILAARLGCEMVTFPGHHISYWDMPDEWAAALREVLHNNKHARGLSVDC
jgi:pimeloyl-ACP methyl ester carboxylesterase